MNSTIILIGPMSAGKSTIGALLAEKLACPRYSLDDLRWDYYKEIGYDESSADRIRQTEGMTGLLQYWKPFEAHAVVRILAEYRSGVIDFGAGHSVYEDEVLFSRVQQALAPNPFVILLLPSSDPDESVEILNKRFVEMLALEGIEADSRTLEVNEHFVKHPSNQLLAKITVYTKGKTPDETCAEILQQIQWQMNR
jgi:shikimate kinase